MLHMTRWIAVVSLVGLPACNDDSKEKDAVKLGAIAGVSGGLALYGQGLENAIHLAVQQINDAGGVLGKTLEVEVRDSQVDAAVATAEAEDLVNNVGVPAILGMISTPCAFAVAEVASPKNVLTLVSGASHVPDLDHGGYLFRNVASLSLEAAVLAQRLHDQGHRDLVTIAAESHPYTNTFASLTRTAFAGLADTTAAAVSHDYDAPDDYDFAAVLAEAYGHNPDVIFLASYAKDGTNLLKAWAPADYTGEWYLADPLRSANVAESVGATKLDSNVYGVALPAPGGAPFEAFTAAYASAYGEDPPLRAWNQYDAVFLAALAIEKAGTADGESIRQAIPLVANAPGTTVTPSEYAAALGLLASGTDIDLSGASGSMDFDDTGNVTSPVEFWKFSSGEPTTVETVED